MRSIRPFYAVCAASLALSLLGCAHAENAEERQLAELREELTKVQSDRDKFESRVNALELAAADRDTSRPSVSAGPRASGSFDVPTPKLKVVHLTPDGAETEAAQTADDPNDASPRPTLKATGTPDRHSRHGRQETTQDERSDVQNAQISTVPNGDADARPSALDPEAKKAYDAAVGLVSSRQFDRALDALAAFLVKWPDHPLADNAIYWRGECFFAKGDMGRAVEQYEGQLARFPLGNKAPDALLKLAMAEEKLGSADKARFYYERLAKEFPKSDAARRIPRAYAPKEQ